MESYAGMGLGIMKDLIRNEGRRIVSREGKPLKCSQCNAVGQTLIKIEQTQGKADLYFCQDRGRCARRGTVTCSVFWCKEAALYSCSCGLQLCELHEKGYQHGDHFAKRLKDG